MASEIDKNNRMTAGSESEAEYNYQISLDQRKKTEFRTDKVAQAADPFNPGRFTKAMGTYNQLDS